MSAATIATGSIQFKKLLEDNSKFSIPSYQRSYSWTEENWQLLLEDLSQPDAPTGHYLGTLVLQRDPKQDRLSVIDGQQRLVTLAILHHVFSNTDKTSDLVKFGVYGDQVYFEELFRTDAETMMPGADTKSKKQLVSAFKYFSEMKKNSNIALENILTCQFLVYETADLREATKIFHSLNTGGVKLEKIDILRNLLFRNAIDTPAPAELITQIEKTFEKINQSLTIKLINGCETFDLEADQFIRDHWVLYTDQLVSRPDVTDDVPKYLRSLPTADRGPAIKAYLHSLKDHVDSFRLVHAPYFSETATLPKLHEALKSRYRLGKIATFGPYLLAAAQNARLTKTDGEWAEVVELIECQILRIVLAGYNNTISRPEIWRQAWKIASYTRQKTPIDFTALISDIWNNVDTAWWDEAEAKKYKVEVGANENFAENGLKSSKFYIEFNSIYHYLMFEFAKALAQGKLSYDPTENNWLKLTNSPTFKTGLPVPFRNLQIEHIHPQLDASRKDVHRLGNLTLVTEYINKGKLRAKPKLAEKLKFYSEMKSGSPLQQNVLRIAGTPAPESWTSEHAKILEDQFMEFARKRWGSEHSTFADKLFEAWIEDSEKKDSA